MSDTGQPTIWHPHPLLSGVPGSIPTEVVQQSINTVATNDLAAFCGIVDGQIPHKHDPDRIFDFYPALYEAIRFDRPAFVEALMARGVTPRKIYARDAAEAGATGCVKVFVAHGWDVNDFFSRAEPPTFAPATLHRETILWLLDHGADLNLQGHFDLTAMSYAVQFSTPDIVEELVTRHGGDVHKGELLLHTLARCEQRSFHIAGTLPRNSCLSDFSVNCVDMLRVLIKHGAPLNTIEYANHPQSAALRPFRALGTPLHSAASLGHDEAVRLFLKHGADATILDSKGQTAAQRANAAEFTEVAQLLKLAAAEQSRAKRLNRREHL